MNIHVSTHLQHVWYLCDCCSSQVNSVQSRSQAPAFHHFQYVNGKPGQGPGSKANVATHTCTFKPAKMYSPNDFVCLIF